MSDPTDEILMTEFQMGEVDSLGLLYSRYKERLFNYFLRTTGDRNAASDVLMNVFERVIKYKKSFKPKNKFRSWLYQIANNALRDHYRKQDAMKIKYRVTDTMSEADPPIDMEDRKKLLYKALSRLDTKDRRIVNMYYLLEIPYDEIAEMEEITINNARIRICRALKKLNSILKHTAL